MTTNTDVQLRRNCRECHIDRGIDAIYNGGTPNEIAIAHLDNMHHLLSPDNDFWRAHLVNTVPTMSSWARDYIHAKDSVYVDESGRFTYRGKREMRDIRKAFYRTIRKGDIRKAKDMYHNLLSQAQKDLWKHDHYRAYHQKMRELGFHEVF
jgi:hypothetical protein